jgi:cytochrome c oxidase subunit 1
MHLFLMGIITFAFIGFIYYLFPMLTGRLYNEKAAKIQFWMLFVGVSFTFVTQHLLGLYGMPRRVFDYVPVQPLIILNQISTMGAWTIGASMILFIANLIKSSGWGKYADMSDPFELNEQYYDYRRREPQEA